MNINTISTYSSTSGLTTAVVTDFFTVNDVPNYAAVKATCLVTMAAETLINTSGTGVHFSIPLFSVVANTFAPVTVICECIAPLTQGGSAQSTTLTQSLSVAPTPSTLAITNLTLTGSTATINATGTTRGTTIVGTVATAGTATLSAGQFQTDPMNATSTTAMVVKPGFTLYLSFFPTGTLTSGSTYTGTYKYYLLGDTMTYNSSGL